MQHTFIAMVENKPGVLMRICSLFQRVNLNIDSLNVGECEIPGLSRLTLVFSGAHKIAELLRKQFNRLINVTEMHHLETEAAVVRRSTLVKVSAPRENLAEIIEIAGRINAGIADMSDDSLTVEVNGPEERIQNAITELKRFGINEMAYSGYIGMKRGNALAKQRELVS